MAGAMALRSRVMGVSRLRTLPRAHRAVARASTSSEPVAAPDPAPPSDGLDFFGLNVLVTGATGGVGKCVVKELISRNVPTRALVRDLTKGEASLGEYTSQGLELRRGDVYQYSTLPPAVDGCNAIVCCIGANDFKDPFGPFNIDYQGVLNQLAAAQKAGVERFVLVSSIGADDILNPLNLFWGVLFWKKRGEEAVQRSGLATTVVRPGGLLNELRPGQERGGIVMREAGYFDAQTLGSARSILRSQVAEVCVAALVVPEAVGKVVEIVARPGVPDTPLPDLFRDVQQ